MDNPAAGRTGDPRAGSDNIYGGAPGAPPALSKPDTPGGALGPLERMGPKYRFRDRKMQAAYEARLKRLDHWDLRAELAILQTFTEQLLNGHDPLAYREAMAAAVRNLEAGQDERQVAADLREALEARCPDTEALLDTLKEVRATVKAIVDMEVSMKKAWPAERVRRLIEEIMGVVRRHATPAQLEAIGEDLQALKARGL